MISTGNIRPDVLRCTRTWIDASIVLWDPVGSHPVQLYSSGARPLVVRERNCSAKSAFLSP